MRIGTTTSDAIRPLVAVALATALGATLASCGAAGPSDTHAGPPPSPRAGIPGTIATIAGASPITGRQYATAEMAQRAAATRGATGVPVTQLRPPRVLRFDQPPAVCARQYGEVERTPYIASLPPEGQRIQCRRTAISIRQRTVNTLLSGVVTRAEAHRLNVRATDAEVDEHVRAALLPAIGGDDDVAAYTKLTGITGADLRAQATDEVLAAKLREAVVRRGTARADTDAARAYYDDHRDRFTTRERRDVRLIATRSARQARAARAALADGASFATVARRHSVDAESRRRGGRTGPVAQIELGRELGPLVFAARRGRIVGPARADGLHYIVQVRDVVPSRPVSFAQAKRSLLGTLRSPAFVWSEWQRQVATRWKHRIRCAAGYDVVELCGNRGAPVPIPPPYSPPKPPAR